MPNTNFITGSQKIESEEEKNRLKQIVEKYIPQGTGAIIRTVAENVSEDVLRQDIERVLEKWKNISSIEIENYPVKIYEKGGILRKTIVDLIDSGLDIIVCEDENLKHIVEDVFDEIDANVKIEINENSKFKYELEKRNREINDRKIWLKSGGFITIDKTEALTAIDVNSGKYIGKDNLEDTINVVNQEAIIEIAKQLRLRDIGGIIIIDFIDMKEQESKNKILEILKKEIKKDRSKVQIEEFTKLNLLELTRKNMNV
jgi:ribonuclease G